MKLCRVGPVGAELPAMLDSEGTPRSLAGIVGDIDGPLLASGLRGLDGLDISRLPSLAGQRYGACIAQPGKIVCVGLKYSDHAKESNLELPREPILFLKGCIVSGPDDPVVIPPGATKVDWEVELAVVISRRAYRIDEADLPDYIAGYCVLDDISERAFQHERGGQWVKGKSLPGFATIGPWLDG